MGLLGISLIVASVVFVILRPPAWLPPWYHHWRGFGGAITQGPSRDGRKARGEDGDGEKSAANGTVVKDEVKTSRNKIAMPPPPPPPVVQPPTIEEPDEQTTPKAGPTKPSQPVPSLSLSEPDGLPPPARPAASSMRPPPPPTFSMPPPPAPGRLPQPPRLQQFPALNSPQRASGPVPNRSRPSSSGLAPPPTHTSIPKKPRHKVLLTPGHSPLDWARISGGGADLRGLADTSAPYLRVTPSMLRKQTGRKGKDAWMALNGRVYNITPYADFHPGGVPELLRGAARDGTQLFGEIHPWVNYETMLSACLVGLLVDEGESEMDKMD